VSIKITEKQTRFMQLLKPDHMRFERYCLSITGNTEDAKDLASETILEAYSRLESLKDQEKFPNYLFRIAKRLYLKKKRNWWRFQSLKNNESIIADTLPDATVQLDYMIVNEALLKLPIKLKQALILYEISGFSLKEIAEIENSSLSAIKARVMRARNKLKIMLKEKSSTTPYLKEKYKIEKIDLNK